MFPVRKLNLLVLTHELNSNYQGKSQTKPSPFSPNFACLRFGLASWKFLQHKLDGAASPDGATPRDALAVVMGWNFHLMMLILPLLQTKLLIVATFLKIFRLCLVLNTSENYLICCLR